MAKGKKLSYAQREIMKQNGIEDSSNWLFIKEEVTQEDGSKRLDAKIRKIVVRNTNTGEERKFEL